MGAHMDLTSLNTTMATILAAGAVLALALGLIRWIRPRWRKTRATMTAATDVIVGRPAVLDSITGKVLAAELPGVGVRLTQNEQQVELLAIAVTKLVDQQAHQLALEHRVDAHDQRLAALEEAALERIATRAEAIAAWRAMEAAAGGDSGPVDDSPSEDAPSDDTPPAVDQ